MQSDWEAIARWASDGRRFWHALPMMDLGGSIAPSAPHPL
jgi:hypothetical protein